MSDTWTCCGDSLDGVPAPNGMRGGDPTTATTRYRYHMSRPLAPTQWPRTRLNSESTTKLVISTLSVGMVTWVRQGETYERQDRPFRSVGDVIIGSPPLVFDAIVHGCRWKCPLSSSLSPASADYPKRSIHKSGYRMS